MDGGNRRILHASAILALPLLLVVASISDGAPPRTGNHQASQSAPQVSKSGGVLGKFLNSSNQNSSNAPRVHSNTAVRIPASVPATGGATKVQPTAGVLSGLIDSLQPKNKKPHNQSGHANNQSQSAPKVAPNWDGIPYHAPKRSGARVTNAPIRDPSQSNTPRLAAPPAVPAGGANAPSVVTRPAPRPIPALPASSRLQSTKSILQQAPEPKRVAPTPSRATKSAAPESMTAISSRRQLSKPAAPPVEMKPAPPVVSKSLPSASTSSRRVSRKSITALETSEPTSQTRRISVPKPAVKEEYVPKVSRRSLEKETEKTEKPKLTVIERKINKPVPSADVATKQPAPAVKTESKPVEAKPAEAEVAKATQEPVNEPQAVEEAPASTPAPAIAAKPTPKPPATKPALTTKPEPATLSASKTAALQPAPEPAVAPAQVPAPSQPAAMATVPSQTVGHRLGPAPSEFAPQTPVEMELAPRTGSMKPIGSGVLNPADNEGVVSREPAQVEEPRLAQVPHTPQPQRQPLRTVDPYAVGGQPQPMRSAPLPIQPAPMQAAPMPINSNAPANNGFAPITGQPIPTQNPLAVQTPAPTGNPAPTRNLAPTQTPQPRQSVGGVPASVPNGMRPITPQTAQPGKAVVASELPGIRVVTNGPNQIMIRQTHEFEIRVENRGSIDAEGVMVRAMIPDWAEIRGQHASRGSIATQKIEKDDRLVWTIDQLPAGAAEQMVVRLKAERSGTHGLDVDWTLMPQKSVTKIKVQEPQLKLTIEGPEQVVYGKSQSYRVRVLNPGDGIAPNVVFTLSPNSSTPQTQRIGNIPPGKEAQFEVELTAQDLGNLKIDGLATGDLELRAQASKTIRVAAAKLLATLSGPELKYQDSEATYHLQIQNDGIASSDQINASLRLPAGVKYLGGLANATQRGSVLTWQIKSLPPTGTREYQFRCMMSTPGNHSFAFDCKGTAAGQATVAIATQVESIADLVMTINDPSAPAPVGSDVTYEIVIRNRGSKEATDVRAIAQFSHGIEPRRVDGHSGEVLTGQVLFDPITRIAPGQEVKLRVVAKADREGHHRFRSEIRSGDTVLVSEEATHYMSPRSERVSRRSSDSNASR